MRRLVRNPVLQACVDIETRIADNYQGLAGHAEADDELKDLWHTVRLRKYSDRLNDGRGLVFEEP